MAKVLKNSIEAEFQLFECFKIKATHVIWLSKFWGNLSNLANFFCLTYNNRKPAAK